jgi:hypothetical protein
MFDFANAEQIDDPEGDRSCLSNDEVLALASGRATTERLAGMRAHVDRCGECQRVLSGAKESASSGPHELHWGATFREGDVVARRYRIHRFIARGGMGEVYDAFDRDLHERVALKTVLSSSNESFRAVRRLRAEVQLAHRVSHPNVCRIYDLGTHVLPSGAPLNFLTMEFIDGESLRARIERGRLSMEESIAVARQLLLGLAAAHGAGILHRDFKSENVMLRSTKDATSQSAVIMDFGLASPIDANAALFVSGSNALVGTPCYMSPEQLEGAKLSAASDLYSFGVVWFEMLTGALPFSVRTPFDRLRREAPRPSKSGGDVPSELDAIIGRCLSRNRSERFSSAEEVLDALDAMSSRVSRIAPRRRRWRPLAAATAGACAAAMLGWVAMKPQAARPSGAQPQHAVPSPALLAVPPALAVPEPFAIEGKARDGESPATERSTPSAAAAPAAKVARSSRPATAAPGRRSLARVAPKDLHATGAVSPAPAEKVPAAAEFPDGDATNGVAASAAPAARALAAEPAAEDTSARSKTEEDVTAKPARSKTEQHGFLDPFRRSPEP